MKMLDLCCGRLGWAKAFLASGWECTGVDLVAPLEIPPGFTFRQENILDWTAADVAAFDFVCASAPCGQFSVHGMKHFHPNPPYPTLGIQLFNHVRDICEASGVPYVMENVRAAQQFVGNAKHHCGPFYMWGCGVPVLVPQGIIKNWSAKYVDKNGRQRDGGPGRYEWSTSQGRKDATASVAMIPTELSAAVADYAERLVFDFGEVR